MFFIPIGYKIILIIVPSLGTALLDWHTNNKKVKKKIGKLEVLICNTMNFVFVRPSFKVTMSVLSLFSKY